MEPAQFREIDTPRHKGRVYQISRLRLFAISKGDEYMTKVKHIKEKQNQDYAATANVEPIGEDSAIPICKDCQSIHLVMTGS